MKEKITVCKTKNIVEEIEYPQYLIDFFHQHKNTIIDEWSEYPTVYELQVQLSLTKLEYKNVIALRVVEYFFTLLNKENMPGDCPVMHQVVNQFYELGLKVEDVFTNCAAMKNIIVQNMLETSNVSIISNISNIMLVLDYNLKSVLSLYSEKIRSHKNELRKKANIIDENVLYSRTNTAGRIIEVTEAFSKLTGYSKEELVGKTHSLLRSPAVSDDVYKELWQTIKAGKVWKGYFPNIKKDGSIFIANLRILPSFNDDGTISEFLAFRDDITASEMAKYDSLTKLYNRASFDYIYEKYVKESEVKSEPLSIMMVDIDYFKSVNDSFGHTKGDEILVTFAEILKQNTRSSDICARWGGEEFMILLPNSKIETAYEIAERVRTFVDKNLQIEDYNVSCSIGVAEKIFNETSDALFSRVDTCLYAAKNRGRNQTVKE